MGRRVLDDCWRARRPGSVGGAHHRRRAAIVERATGAFAGEAVLNEFDAELNSASFRISLRGPDWFGRGLGTEATRLMVTHGLEVVGLDHIDLEVLARNPRARRVYERVGFVPIEELPEDGEDWVVMRITSVQ